MTCAVTLAIIALLTCSSLAQEPVSPAKLVERCDMILRKNLVDFYLPGCIDSQHGGYFESLQSNRFAATGEKFVTLQARQLWFFSTLASESIRREEALKAAKHGYEFLQSKFLDVKHGGNFAKVSDEGTPTDRRKHAYLNAFVLYGLCAYYEASRDAAVLDAAKRLFALLEKQAHDAQHGGYLEFFEEDWTPIMDRSVSSFIGPGGTKTFNTHLHLLEALTELYRVWPDPLVRQRLEELLVINTSTIRQARFGCNIDGFLRDWKPIETKQNLRASYGHDVEAAWLCLRAARVLDQPVALWRNWAEGLVEYSMKHGYDRQHGGFFYTGPLGQSSDDTKKEWWVQAEGLVCFLELHQLTGNTDYLKHFVQTLEFVEKHQVAAEGSWWASRQADGKSLNDSRSSMWQGAYHNGRAMIYSMKLLKAMEKK